MDFFDERIVRLKKNIDIFEKYVTRCEVGILIQDDLRGNFEKKGKELLPKELVGAFLQIRSVHYTNIVMKRLEEYTFPEWVTCLNEKILLEYTLPIFSRVLLFYPRLCGINSEWEILYEITKIEDKFWEIHSEWKNFFVNIIGEVLDGKDSLALNEYSYQFSRFANRIC